MLNSLGFETVTRLGQGVHSAPDEAVDGHHGGGHHDGGGKKKLEVAGVGSLADGGSQSNGCVNVSLQLGVFRYDARIPGTARGCHETGDEIRKDSRQDQLLPACDSGEPEN